MEPLQRPGIPDPVRSGPFIYGIEGLATSGITRAPLRELRLLFRKGAAAFRRRAATRDWIIAQLLLYGVSFSKADRKPALMDTLEKAVKSGQCDKPGPAVCAVEDALRCQYAAKMEGYRHALERWTDHEFERLQGNPSKEVSFDIDRFLAKYFLHGRHGRPDRGKTRDALALYGRSFYGHTTMVRLARAVEAVPGLALHSTRDLVVIGWDTELDRGLEREFSKLDSPDRDDSSLPTREANLDFDRFLKKHLHIGFNGVATASGEKPPAPVTLFSFFENGPLLYDFVSRTPALCIKSVRHKNGTKKMILGWDVRKVDAEVRRITEQRRRYRYGEEQAAKKREEGREKWERILKPHSEYAARHQPSVGALDLQHLRGSYIVRCDDLHQSFDMDEPSTLDIFPAESCHGLKASFSFGFMKGIMLLATSERSLELLREEQPEEDESEDEAGYGEWDEHNGRAAASGSVGEKRQVGSIVDPWGVLAARAKRQKTAVEEQGSYPNRVYFQVAYDEFDADPGMATDMNQQVGLLDFDSQLSAHGVVQLPDLNSEPMTLSIYKVADSPAAGREPWPWSFFIQRLRRCTWAR